MTLAEKLRFLAGRAEDKKPFLINEREYEFYKNELRFINGLSNIKINDLESSELKLKPKWGFTEDEKTILRNIEDRAKWIVRDESGGVYLHHHKPVKIGNVWIYETNTYFSMGVFNHLFKSVQWEDEEPCEFRRYL